MPSQNKKQKTAGVPKDAEEKELEKSLFGDLSDDVWDKAGRELEDYNEPVDKSDEEEEAIQDDQLFFLDSGPLFTMDSTPTPIAEEEHESNEEEEEEEEDEEEETEETEATEYFQKAAWVDEDDARLQISLKSTDRLKKLRKTEDEDVVSGAEYERRLRQQFSKIYPRPAWAKLPSEIALDSKKRKASESDDEDGSDYEGEDQLDEETRIDLLKSTYGILEKRGTKQLLSTKHIDVVRMKDANQMSPAKATITSVAFHPDAQVMLTGSLDKTLRLFQIDGKVNPKIQSVHFKDTPITNAAFHTSGNQIIVTGRRKHYYIYDVQSGVMDRCPGIWGKEEKSLEKFSISPCGRYIAFLGTNGHIILVSYLTKQWLADLKMNRTVESVDWSSDGEYLFSIGAEGEVYQWHIGQRECVKRWVDDGALNPSVVRVSHDEKYYATGSSAGIVNVYDRTVLAPNTPRPKPLKTIDNLTTHISNIKFNHDSQLMAISSIRKRDAFKLVHLPSCTVYSSWPTDKTPLGYVSAFDFSPNSDYLAIGNAKGRVLLYGLKHYAL
ncbi:U3 snoRNP protein [Apophysomyces ossiformis]|uniref:U3 small nucleolar RNA-associated protein 18 homolog n=1 Tax=Apophysomyces ossiformis TaxID=679940 RepID=A0A8H7BUN8_9FUNG|nr:U3 snoRNP protein [Apophysomyces ossiformis]